MGQTMFSRSSKRFPDVTHTSQAISVQLVSFLETPNMLDWKLSSSAVGSRWLKKEGMNYRKLHTLNGDSSLDLSSSLLIFCVCMCVETRS